MSRSTSPASDGARRADRPTFRKRDAHRGSTELEALGLIWLAEAMDDGGAHVVPVTTGSGWLEEPRLRESGCTPAAAEAFGRALAVTHAAGAREHGAAPTGWSHPAGWMGSADLPLRPGADGAAGAPTSPGLRRWGEFYAEDRLLPYLPAAVRNGSMSTAGAAVVERVASRLADGDFDAPQPGLLAARAGRDGLPHDASRVAARTHGDLWSGNVLWVPRSEVEDWAPGRAGLGPATAPASAAAATTTPEAGSRTGATTGGDAAGHGATRPGTRSADGPAAGTDVVGVLIDPAAQGGHAETDLAELAVFGQRHLDRVLAGYDEVSPLAGGLRERIGLHQLHMVLIHAVLFGGSYGAETVSLARRYA